ncbi:MAG TPA: phosphotransferase, partial [Kribbella sp.]|uniref:phosphotransferase family protein n=1 Tax=Kribbella sp. TaxID=1871183 RepID=UPI002D77C4FF
PGEMLSALVAEGRAGDDDWRSVGTTFRRLHDIRFPKGLAGLLTEDKLVLESVDPVNAMHELLVEAEPKLKVKLPVVVPHLPRLHAVIDENAPALRETATALLHLDVNPANIIVGPTRTTLIDWGEPGVADPAREIAALEEHIYLINGSEIPAAFYETYGPRSLPNTAIHRLTGAIGWYSEDDFEDWATEEDLDPALKAQGRPLAGRSEGLPHRDRPPPEGVLNLSVESGDLVVVDQPVVTDPAQDHAEPHHPGSASRRRLPATDSAARCPTRRKARPRRYRRISSDDRWSTHRRTGPGPWSRGATRPAPPYGPPSRP